MAAPWERRQAGVEADVVAVSSFEDLRAQRSDVAGRIVLFNAMFTTYGETVTYRTGGARTAAQLGAVAVLVRAVGPTGLRTPHTGQLQYGQDVTQIPAAVVSSEDADRMVRLIARGQRVRVRLTMEAHFEADAESANVVGEIRGRERPDEIVLLGGHIDSWDVGTGASDDAVGCIVTWEAARLMVRLGIRPRRTVRIVLWTNEENGLRGATAYAEKYAADARNHVFALESDSGVFDPASLGFTGSARARSVIRDIASLLAPARVVGSRRRRWRRRRGTDRAGRQRADDGIPGQPYAVLPDSPYAGGHGGAYCAPGSVEGRGRDRRDGVCDCGDAGKTSAVMSRLKPARQRSSASVTSRMRDWRGALCHCTRIGL